MNTEDEEKGPFSPEIVGPFVSEHRVSINGYRVPYITATPLEDGRVNLYVDRRFGLNEPVSREEFNRWVYILANAMAVAAGYSSHGENCQPINPHKVRMAGLSSSDPAPTFTIIDGGRE